MWLIRVHGVDVHVKDLEFLDQRIWVLLDVDLLNHDFLACLGALSEEDLALGRAALRSAVAHYFLGK